jgi:hypothetical protein
MLMDMIDFWPSIKVDLTVSNAVLTWRQGRKVTAGISALRHALLPIRLRAQNKNGIIRAHMRKISYRDNEKIRVIKWMRSISV